MADHTFDLVVLGGGSGGYAAALRAAELGSRVALIEKGKVGGTCLHRGCIPTKALLHSAEIADSARDAEKTGVLATFEGIDPERLAAYRDGVVARKYKGLQALIRARGITVVEGFGRLVSGTTVAVGDDVYEGRNVVLATGASARTLPGLEIGGRVITSDEALQLDHVPASVAVLGGGVIGVEFASLWRSLGAEVTIIEALPHLLPLEDEAISKGLERAFRRREIDFRLGVPFRGAEQTDAGVTVALENGDTIEVELLLVAVGRAPVTGGLGLEELGVELERGFVATDERLQTSVPGLYAVGDIVAGPQLAHRGFQHGVFVAEEIAGLAPAVIGDALIPKIAYCSPEVASVGLSEAAAVERYGADAVNAVSSYEYSLAGNARSEILGTNGVVKIVRVAGGPVVGIHLLGARVGELIGEAQLAVGWEAHPEDVAPFVHAHPTQNEALGEAFLKLAGKPLHAL
ncbi:dihydrolipoyl dehydrogenase [Gryllotalpicola protaetiae]|uniref:Dihydrolipoyl dehydrogenase n=1 Tax=Gryllotalpicola protaetiae TaxID=2419771 RepID=A0A387C383_9MICO|nr:dihydrolipoyl dehydrogenase [Gryllotalpicola protaetiae]AYG05021.1 dihydrolipoyl dehydrogenase [Gryllotalpicola protaetiae]